MADSRLVPNQWETSLQCNAVSHWLDANPESALTHYRPRSNRFLDELRFLGGYPRVLTGRVVDKKDEEHEPDTTYDPWNYMMTSSNGNIFRATGPLCGEFTGNGWIPRTKASDAELWCFLWSAPWTNSWGNNREVGGLRHHRAHYDVIVMRKESSNGACINWLTGIKRL